MHEEILSAKLTELIPFIKSFSDEFGLVGGTSIALQLGHRRSIDFDLITFSEIDATKIRSRIGAQFPVEATLVNEVGEYTIVVNGVKITFLHYPFKVSLEVDFQEGIYMPSLNSLASMKAYALGRRAKWKDYVDLYFIFQKFSFEEICQKANEIFGTEFSEKLFFEKSWHFLTMWTIAKKLITWGDLR
jgi:hypothetical protein